ncbi:LicD family protein [Butyrivibrio sp. M55]|uniref:LicD family protein n=1 Tax=Butyrivibrio sp. M55 TaxID=1855323 RepID=UPI0008E0CACD|nr:LicD family protein [Butyrivibrio sp. M55]SFU65796.1 Phosphorylcholine metabolism protein LicD [Butyrivibrio sp. M55]
MINNNSDEMNMVPLENISFPESFFRPEVRNGFYISTMMKRYWAGQLQMLSDIDKLCREHDIKWFAEYGTLIGAVRHGGYIPWDDDFDICMLRDDYERFFEIARKELPSVYIILTLNDVENEYNNFLGRIVNSHAIDCSKEHLDLFSGCPYTVGVDIFPMDGVYNDAEKEKERQERVRRIITAHDAISEKDSLGEYTNEIESLLIDVEKENNVHFHRGKKLLHEMEVLIDKIFMECPVSEADNVALMPFYLKYGNHIFPKKYFQSSIDMKFENTMLKVSAYYDRILLSNYGNYMEIHKSGGMHEYPIYISQENLLKEKMGHNPFRYTLDNNELLNSVRRYMGRMLMPVQEKEKMTIVFLPCRVKWWNTLDGLWRKYKSEGHEVHVLPINYYDCDFIGNVGEMHDERAFFPDYLSVEDCEKFDYAGIHPDKIVIQVPYDAWNTAFTVHEFFYSGNLLNVTDELIYVPCYDIDDPVDDDDKACRCIEILAEQPAVVNADKVLLKSEKQRELYLKKLIGLTGEETRAFWEQKIEVSDLVAEPESDTDTFTSDEGEWNEFLGKYEGRKVVVYYFSISTLMEYGEKAVDKFERALETFSEYTGKMTAVFVPQDYLTANLDIVDETVRNRYIAFVDKVKETEGCIYDEENRSLQFIDRWNGYYGDAGVVARKCVDMKIPVMLEDVNV